MTVVIFLTVITTIFTGILAYFMTRMTRTLGSILGLVDTGMGIQLRTTSNALQRVADLTGNQADIDAANLAKKILAEHDIKQATV